jgi:ADP-ribose pyrophosphatase YjhB (NUDIX family)
MNYCSNCGSDQLQQMVPPGDTRMRQVCTRCNTIHYDNPKVVAGCLPIWEGKVLLCRRAIEPRRGFWNLPSGYLEHGETVEEGAARELWEEAEARIDIRKLHCVYSIPHIGQVYMHFIGELKEGKFGVGEESLESRLFAKEEIPWDEIAFTSTAYSLNRYFEDRAAGLEQTHVGQFHP